MEVPLHPFGLNLLGTVRFQEHFCALLVGLAFGLSIGVGGAWVLGSGGSGAAVSLVSVTASATLFSQQEDVAPSANHYTIEDLTLPFDGYEETHEIAYDAASHTAFISQMIASRLVQVSFDGARLSGAVRRWTVGTAGKSGLHNVQASRSRPGCLWLSLQFNDSVHLVDPSEGFQTLRSLKTPTQLPLGQGGGTVPVGGPHAAVEAMDGAIWVGLKAANQALRGSMSSTGLTAADRPSSYWAVWRIELSKYDPAEPPAFGGELFAAPKSPTMIAFDGQGNTFISCDGVSTVMRVSVDRIPQQIPLPRGFAEHGNGPGIAADPNGNIWLTALRSMDGSLVRFASGSTDPELITVLPSTRCQGISCVGWQPAQSERQIIHLTFSAAGGVSRRANVLYVLTSSLLAGNADEAIYAIELADDWRTLRPSGEVGVQTIWLPEDHSAAHRLQVVAPAWSSPHHAAFFDRRDGMGGNGIIATGLHQNQIFYVRGRSL